MANIQISEELFIKLVKYHLFDVVDDSEIIKQQLIDKLDKIALRADYTAYKTATNDTDKEIARQRYLDKKGIHKDFRW